MIGVDEGEVRHLPPGVGAPVLTDGTDTTIVAVAASELSSDPVGRAVIRPLQDVGATGGVLFVLINVAPQVGGTSRIGAGDDILVMAAGLSPEVVPVGVHPEIDDSPAPVMRPEVDLGVGGDGVVAGPNRRTDQDGAVGGEDGLGGISVPAIRLDSDHGNLHTTADLPLLGDLQSPGPVHLQVVIQVVVGVAPTRSKT